MAAGWNELDQFCKDLSRRLTDAIRRLLEEKHLYQRIEVSVDDLIDATVSRFPAHAQNEIREALAKLQQVPWEPGKTAGLWRAGEELQLPGRVDFQVPDVKLFCAFCDATHPFNARRGIDLTEQGFSDWRKTSEGRERVEQCLSFSFECQSCKGPPDVFLVRRERMKLILAGRAPMEVAQVPREIPKRVSKFFSGAVVAHQSGQTLAGNFLLRTLLEQFALDYLKVEPEEPERRADAAIDAYMATLPEDLKRENRLPSFKALYRELSADIHQAKGDAQTFDNACRAIEKHFKGRALFELL